MLLSPLFQLPFPFPTRFAKSAILLFLIEFLFHKFLDIYYTCIIHAFLDSYFQDDDSDLDYELEPLPSISAESTPECSACVKVDILILHSISIF